MVPEDGLRQGSSKRSGGWQGWQMLADHLVPSTIGPGEAKFIYRLLLDDRGGTRGEVFRLLESSPPDELPESTVVRDILLGRSSSDLKMRLRAISSFETVGTLLAFSIR